jgi:hypothetical protein
MTRFLAVVYVTLMVGTTGFALPANTQIRGLPQFGVKLVGSDPRQPAIENGSQRRVIIYVLRWAVQRGAHVRHEAEVTSSLLARRNIGTAESVSIPPGGTRTHRYSSPAPLGGEVVGVSLDSVVFEDGEFVGPDESGSYENLVARIDAERDVHRLVSDRAPSVSLDQVFARVVALAEGTSAVPSGAPVSRRLYATWQKNSAKELVDVRRRDGDGAVIGLVTRSADYPRLWREGQR